MEKKLSEVLLPPSLRTKTPYFGRRCHISRRENESPSRSPAYSSPFSFSAGIASGTFGPLASVFSSSSPPPPLKNKRSFVFYRCRKASGRLDVRLLFVFSPYVHRLLSLPFSQMTSDEHPLTNTHHGNVRGGGGRALLAITQKTGCVSSYLIALTRLEYLFQLLRLAN